MAIAFIDSTIAEGSGATSGSIDTTGANLIVVCVGSNYSGPQVSAITDSKSNTWTALTGRGAVAKGRIFYCLNPTVGSGHTFTNSADGDRLFALAFSGVDSYENDSGAADADQPGSLTPSLDGSLLVTMMRDFAGNLSINSGFTIAELDSGNDSGAAYLIQLTAAAVNPTWSGNSGGDRVVAMASFLPASDPPPGGQMTGDEGGVLYQHVTNW